MPKAIIMTATVLGIIFAIGICIGLTYLAVACLTYIMCYCFGVEWSWTFALGIYVTMIFLAWGYRWITGGRKNDA